jgi:hypothetical protein
MAEKQSIHQNKHKHKLAYSTPFLSELTVASLPQHLITFVYAREVDTVTA